MKNFKVVIKLPEKTEFLFLCPKCNKLKYDKTTDIPFCFECKKIMIRKIKK